MNRHRLGTKQGQPRNRRKCIGYVDPETGKEIFHAKYLERVWGTKRQPEIGNVKLFSLDDVGRSVNKEYGVNYLLDNIAYSIGLADALKNSLPYDWERVLTLANFMVASGEPAVYCKNWAAKTDSID
jgi:hypothetical protein